MTGSESTDGTTFGAATPSKTLIVLETPDSGRLARGLDRTFPRRNFIVKNEGGMWLQCGTTHSSH